MHVPPLSRLIPLLICFGLTVRAEVPGKEEEAPPPYLEMSGEAQSRRTWIDGTRDWIYGKSHGAVVWLDNRFVDETQQEVVETPPSRFRIGLLAEVGLKPEGTIEFSPVADFQTDVALPNLERRLKLFVSTRDPTALEGTDSFDQDNALRVGASREFFKNWDTSAGVKTKWLPEAFAYVQWKPKYQWGPHWSVFPSMKFFWESEDKLGTSTALIFNRWKGRGLFRQTFSGKYTQRDEDQDEKNAAKPDHYQFGDDGEGVRWQSATIFGYVPLLLDEKDYGRRVGGDDVAKGYGAKVQVQGNAASTLRVTGTLFMKRPLYKDFVYLILAPEVVWEEETNWDEEFILKFGFDMLLWGDDPYRKP